MKLGILKTDAVRPELVGQYGEYPDMFVRLLSEAGADLEFMVYDVECGEYPQHIDEADAYLITGSKSSVYDDKPWIHTLMAFVRELHSQRKKLIGICFGHQLVAQALGGKTEKSPKGWGVGIHTHRFSCKPAWHDGGAEELQIMVSHQDQVVQPATGAQVLAGSAFCENAVTQLDDHILTFQGHPEFVESYARALLEFRRDVLGDAAYHGAMASLAGEQGSQSQRVAGWIRAFLAA